MNKIECICVYLGIDWCSISFGYSIKYSAHFFLIQYRKQTKQYHWVLNRQRSVAVFFVSSSSRYSVYIISTELECEMPPFSLDHCFLPFVSVATHAMRTAKCLLGASTSKRNWLLNFNTFFARLLSLLFYIYVCVSADFQSGVMREA